jgi:K+-transporting ATPase ATPase A chain
MMDVVYVGLILVPLGGLVPVWLMQLGEIIFGGVGSGLYEILLFAVVAVFVAGLMVGRTPELTEVLYAFSSAANNNGSAFAGLGANTPFYNTALGPIVEHFIAHS